MLTTVKKCGNLTELIEKEGEVVGQTNDLPTLVMWRSMKVRRLLLVWFGVQTVLMLVMLWLGDFEAYVGWNVLFSSKALGLAIGRFLMAGYMLACCGLIGYMSLHLISIGGLMSADGPQINIRPFVVALNLVSAMTFGMVLLVRATWLTFGPLWPTAEVFLLAAPLLAAGYLAFTIWRLPGRLNADVAFH